MSDAKQAPGPAEAKPAGDEAAAAAPAAKAKPGMPAGVLLAVIALAGLGGGGALGAFVVGPPVVAARQHGALAAAIDSLTGATRKAKKGKKDGGKAKKGEHGDAKTPVYKLDNLIVNPAGTEGQRFLMCSVAIQLEDEKLTDELRDHEVELRDKVVSTLESQTLEQITRPGARDSLRVRIAHVVRPLLGESGADSEIRVYLPQFVIQ